MDIRRSPLASKRRFAPMSNASTRRKSWRRSGQVASERLADVTLNIAENGYPPIPSGVEEKICAHVEREHTPEVVAAFKAAGGARRAARAEAGGGAAIP